MYQVFIAHMSPACKGSSVLQCFKHGNMTVVRNGIISTWDCHIYGLQKIKKATKSLGTVASLPGSYEGEEEREPGTHCLHIRQVPLVTCKLLHYTNTLQSISVYL